MVLMTTIVLGGVMSAFAKLIGLNAEQEEDELTGTHDDKIERLTDVVFKQRRKGWCKKKFNWLDVRVLKPLFGGDLTKGLNKRTSSKLENRVNIIDSADLNEDLSQSNNSKKDDFLETKHNTLMKGANLDMKKNMRMKINSG
eukprot:CAMPEP_0205828104 /NCGR_PEP_ID=MMETSP0206-20130828/34103_1 /ASSEMBLY_ACC=CAM_ASM_000279 /TAXON_ID=36767 /ORGANISM="Euplotes focardii, Strain TN1" /LENGTH=141 /DNA_ID=CAMNT_0053129603 /DNA_START=1159 /DNA_END=1581 /DNA_ORIENTATION=-